MSNLPVTHTGQQLFPGEAEWAMMKESANMLIKSGFLPTAINSPEKAIAIMLKGRELGLPPMQAFTSINIIQGKPTMNAETMLAMIFKAYPKTRLTYIQYDDTACTIEVTKPGNEPNRFTFTFEDAEKAKLTRKENWTTYRRAMLRSRCIAEMARALFPDALMGCSYSEEELEDPVVVVKTEHAASSPSGAAQTVRVEESPTERMLIAFDKLGITAEMIDGYLASNDSAGTAQNHSPDDRKLLLQLYQDVKAGRIVVSDFKFIPDDGETIEGEVE